MYDDGKEIIIKLDPATLRQLEGGGKLSMNDIQLVCKTKLKCGLGAKMKKIRPVPPPRKKKKTLLPCIRHTSRVLRKPCFTKLSVVIFSK